MSFIYDLRNSGKLTKNRADVTGGLPKRTEKGHVANEEDEKRKNDERKGHEKEKKQEKEKEEEKEKEKQKEKAFRRGLEKEN